MLELPKIGSTELDFGFLLKRIISAIYSSSFLSL